MSELQINTPYWRMDGHISFEMETPDRWDIMFHLIPSKFSNARIPHNVREHIHEYSELTQSLLESGM